MGESKYLFYYIQEKIISSVSEAMDANPAAVSHSTCDGAT